MCTKIIVLLTGQVNPAVTGVLVLASSGRASVPQSPEIPPGPHPLVR